MRRSYSGAYSLTWRKSEQSLADSLESQLAIKLAGKHSQHGNFTVYQAESQSLPPFDVGLLTGDFRRALATDIDNALSKAEVIEAVPTRPPQAAIVPPYTLRKVQPVPAFPR